MALSGCHANTNRRSIFVFSSYPDGFEQTNSHWRMMLRTVLLLFSNVSGSGKEGNFHGQELEPPDASSRVESPEAGTDGERIRGKTQ